MPPPYPNWIPGITPHTNCHATARNWRAVHNTTAIQVIGSTYRNSLPINDTFELVDPNQMPWLYLGALRIEVLCSWFGVKPPTTHPNITLVPGQFQILQGYTGNVVDELRA